MPTNRHPIRHPHRGRLNHLQEMVLVYGEDPRWADAFDDEEAQREAWIRNRERILAGYRHGRRPMAWWTFEAPIPFPGYERQQSVLFEAGLLGQNEAATLVSEWRRQFERAYEPGFFHCAGPGRIFEGASARRQHFAWAGIPRALLAQWTKERRRRTRVVRKAGGHRGVPGAGRLRCGV